MTNTFNSFQRSCLALYSVVSMMINCYRLNASKCQKLLKRINQKSKKSFFKIVVVVVDVRLMCYDGNDNDDIYETISLSTPSTTGK